MRIIEKLTILIISILINISAFAQNSYRFRDVGVKDGLPYGIAMCFYQDEFGMMWIGTQNGLIRYDGVNADCFRPEPGNSGSIYSNNIKTVCGNGDGKIYIICKNGLCVFDMKEERFTTLLRSGAQNIFCKNGRLWVATDDKIMRMGENGLEDYFYPDPGFGRGRILLESSNGRLYLGSDNGLMVLDGNAKPTSLEKGIFIQDIFEDSKHNIWYGTRNGLTVIREDGSKQVWKHSDTNPESLYSDYVTSICEDASGKYWIGTLEGLNIYDSSSGRMIRANSNPGAERLTPSHIIRDSKNTMWMCSNGGIKTYNRLSAAFKFHDDVLSIPGTMFVTAFAEDPATGDLFLGAKGSGLLKMNARTGKTALYPGGEVLSTLVIQHMVMEPGTRTLWIGTRLGGLYKLEVETGRLEAVTGNPDSTETPLRENICHVSVFEDRIIVATHNMVVSLDPKTQEWEKLSTAREIDKRFFYDLLVDRDANCWMSVSTGTMKRNLITGEEKKYFFGRDSFIGTDYVNISFQDSKGRVWLGTSGGGFLLYKPETDSFVKYTKATSNLPSDFILGLSESPSGYILLMTGDGVSMFDAENETFHNYSTADVFPVGSPRLNGLFVTSDGEIYAAGFHSLVSFRENRLNIQESPDRIFFSSVSLNNGKPENLLYSDGIRFRGVCPLLEIRTSAPNFIRGNQMEYRLVGISDEWIKGTAGQKLTFTNVRPGKYTLEVRSGDATNSLSIRILRRWFASIPAQILYSLLIAGLVFAAFLFYKSRITLKNSLTQEKREKEQIQEMNDSKLRFFTYISHEIRTPVTLIQSQIESLLSSNNIPPFIYNKVLGMNRNMGKINSLLGELLDYRKQEQGNLIAQACFSEQDLVPQLGRVSLIFKEFAASRDLTFSFTNRHDGKLMMWYDPDQIDKVLYNLLSNACKNTKAGGDVSLSLTSDDKYATITVSDTGCGIPEKYIESIFAPFFQVPGGSTSSQGTGLGLSITKGIIDAHGGTIECRSTENIGTTFTVRLPLGDAHVSEEMKAAPKEEKTKERTFEKPDDKFLEDVRKNQGDVQPTILIVEDNDELRESLATIFEPIYNVVQACDGADAFEKLEKSVPDIILSDLMMPNMDGNELCIKVKNNFYTSHIPIVILTAKVAEESMLETLRNGADDYIVKPFNPKILISKCNNLVSTRLNLQQKFAKSMSGSTEILATNEIDRQFIKKAVQVVTDNIMNADFDVAQFAEQMDLGRSHLFSKLKGVTGQTPNRFITTIRLKHSIELLSSNSDLSISDISIRSGFSSSSYFIKTFKSAYGITPSAYRESQKEIG